MTDPGIFPYAPLTPPDDVNPALARWAFKELQDVSDWLAVRPPRTAILVGDPDSFTLNATKNLLQNYGTALEGEGFTGATDDASGTITVPFTGFYRMFWHCFGNQGNNTKEEEMYLF